MESEYHLQPKQVLIRIVSVIICGVGASACGYSLTLQVAEVGNITTSITWFSGLFAVVFALAGYAVSCDPGKGKSFIVPSAIIVIALAIAGTILAHMFLYAGIVIYIALVAAAIEVVFLVVYHFILKREDPDAL